MENMSPEYDEYFADPRRIERVQRAQVEYWGQLFRGVIDESFMARRRATGFDFDAAAELLEAAAALPEAP